MPVGYAVTVVLLGIGSIFALAPIRRGPLRRPSYFVGLVLNELPFLALYWLAAATALAMIDGDLAGRWMWLTGLAALTAGGLVVVALRAVPARATTMRALDDGLPSGWRGTLDRETVARFRTRLPWGRILTLPFLVARRDVERIANLSYGVAGKRNLLDIYVRRDRPAGGPVLVYFHGGSFVRGRKNREARTLLYRLASQGWMCVSATYRFRPDAEFPGQHVDAKRVIAWARQHAPEYGADAGHLFIAGSSAGAHLAAFAALTPGDATYQPGFEAADTSVSAAICLYGYYGRLDRGPDLSSPADHIRADAPPFFLTHGTKDTSVPVEWARKFVGQLREHSRSPIVYAELPGAHHAFDLIHSMRSDAMVDGVEAFAAWVRSNLTS